MYLVIIETQNRWPNSIYRKPQRKVTKLKSQILYFPILCHVSHTVSLGYLCFQQVNQTWACNPIEKPALGQRSTSKKHLTSMSYWLEPAIWSRDTGQQIPCFDRCQLIITWMSNIKEVHSKPRLHVSVNLLFGVWQPSCATPPSSSSSSSSCVRAHEQYR